MASLLARFREPLLAQLIGDDRAHRLHDVEAMLYRDDAPAQPVGRIWESRWSNGMGTLTVDLDRVPEVHSGTARLYADGVLFAGLDFTGNKLAFSWLGVLSGESLSFAVGQVLRLEVGELVVSGTVTAR